MRLIDADQFNGKVIASHTGCGVIKLIAINDVPTACDPDKVVEQLKKKIQTHERCIEYEKKNGTITEEFQQRKAVEVLKDAIEIVKGGGVDG